MKVFRVTVFCVVAIALLASAVQKEPISKARLGQLLFFDPILSGDHSISCASCHLPANAFADTLPVSKGVAGRSGTRNTPSVMNLSLTRNFFWDGRASSLQQQALIPIENHDEMDLPLDEALNRLKADSGYRMYFREAFQSEATRENLGLAIAAFERTLETSETAFDLWKQSGDSSLVSVEVRRGFELFNSKGKCNKCHFGGDFAQQEFRNIGLFNGKALNDSGRITQTQKTSDLGRFKIAGLRNVAITSPYMHNGMFATLKEVIEFYNDPSKVVTDAINRDSILNQPLNLTSQDKKDLEEFLMSLTDKRFIK